MFAAQGLEALTKMDFNKNQSNIFDSVMPQLTTALIGTELTKLQDALKEVNRKKNPYRNMHHP